MIPNTACTTKGHRWTSEYLDGPAGAIYHTLVCTVCGIESPNPPVELQTELPFPGTGAGAGNPPADP